MTSSPSKGDGQHLVLPLPGRVKCGALRLPRRRGAVADARIIDDSVLLVVAQHHKCLKGLFTNSENSCAHHV